MADFDAESYLAQLTTRPGAYQMFDSQGELLYVGKAKNLKNRVTSYFRASGLSAKTMALVARIANIEVTVTTTERATGRTEVVPFWLAAEYAEWGGARNANQPLTHLRTELRDFTPNLFAHAPIEYRCASCQATPSVNLGKRMNY